jgi:hypothetical protein
MYFLPATQALQKYGAEINRDISGDDGFTWAKRLGTRNGRNNPDLALLEPADQPTSAFGGP